MDRVLFCFVWRHLGGLVLLNGNEAESFQVVFFFIKEFFRRFLRHFLFHLPLALPYFFTFLFEKNIFDPTSRKWIPLISTDWIFRHDFLFFSTRIEITERAVGGVFGLYFDFFLQAIDWKRAPFSAFISGAVCFVCYIFFFASENEPFVKTPRPK